MFKSKVSASILALFLLAAPALAAPGDDAEAPASTWETALRWLSAAIDDIRIWQMGSGTVPPTPPGGGGSTTNGGGCVDPNGGCGH